MKLRLSLALSMLTLFAAEAQSAKWKNYEDFAMVSANGYDLAVHCDPENPHRFFSLAYSLPTSIMHDDLHNETVVELHYGIDQESEEPKSLGHARDEHFQFNTSLGRMSVNIVNGEAYAAARALMKAKRSILVWLSTTGETHRYSFGEFPAKGSSEAIGYHLSKCKKAFEKAKMAQ